MDTSELQKFVKQQKTARRLTVFSAILMAIISIVLLLMIPYDRPFFLYLVPLSYMAPYVIILILYVPFHFIFRLFGKKKIDGPIGIALSVILEVTILLSSCQHLPIMLICFLYFLTGTSVLLFIAVFFLVGYVGYKLTRANAKLSVESDIDSVISVRKQWIREYLKWAVLALIGIVCLMGLGVYRHKYFTMIDCVVLSIQSAVIIFQTVLLPYYNTYNDHYNDKEFVFFLRSFKIENETESAIVSKIHKALSNHSFFHTYRILRVGNPSLLMYSPEMGVDTFFLPSENWQPIVRKYVEIAKYIVVLINVHNQQDNEVRFTQGVIWELYNNYSLREKFVYCIYNYSQQDSLSYINTLDNDKIDHPLTDCIARLLDKHDDLMFEDDICAFTFDGIRCRCYEGLTTAVKAKLSHQVRMMWIVNMSSN